MLDVINGQELGDSFIEELIGYLKFWGSHQQVPRLKPTNSIILGNL